MSQIRKSVYSLENNKIAYVITTNISSKEDWKTEYEYNSTNQLSKKTSYKVGSLQGYVATINYANENISSLNAKEVHLFHY